MKPWGPEIQTIMTPPCGRQANRGVSNKPFPAELVVVRDNYPLTPLPLPYRSSRDSSLTTTAGLPATTEYGGTSLVTTAPAATIPPSPTETPRKTMAHAPIQASSPILIGFSSREISRG